ncbi:MAG: hypothetical protein E6Q76_07420 [Rhizobium sp.]|nr:MAG: hypothetical protein E6Q76_07420 [Rhizobium sp.]
MEANIQKNTARPYRAYADAWLRTMMSRYLNMAMVLTCAILFTFASMPDIAALGNSAVTYSILGLAAAEIVAIVRLAQRIQLMFAELKLRRGNAR